MTQAGAHAIVVGASLAGLCTAAVLAERFERVTIVERDGLPPDGRHRGGVPQGRHAHVLLPAGVRGLAELFPEIADDLRSHDADIIPATQFRFFIAGGRLRLEDPALQIVGATRPLLEAVVRARVRALPGVGFVEGDARGLIATADRSHVTGLRMPPGHPDADRVAAGDLVVDAGGRGSRSPHWLAELGYTAPDEQRFRVGVHYTTRLFHRTEQDLDGCRHVVVSIPRGQRRGGLALAVEGDRWLVTLVGLAGERPPADLDGFAAYARSLWTPDLHGLVAGGAPVGEASTGAFPTYLRRRYDRLGRVPGRFVPVGDAVCSLNPLYAQGMSVAVREAAALGQVLDRHGPQRAGPAFFRRTRPIVDHAWALATGADLGHPELEGPRTSGWRVLDGYLGRLLPVAHHDPVVARAFLAVSGLVEPPRHLMHPRIAWRVLRAGRAHAQRPAAVRHAGAAGR